MIDIQKNVSLQAYNSFQVECQAKEFVSISDIQTLFEVLKWGKESDKHFFLLNGGSNILFTRAVEETVILLQNKGIHIVKEDTDSILIEVQAGENWHEFVQYCVQNNWGGLENLSLIPGNVGTSPIQNIGAYGVEIKDCFHSLHAIHLDTLEKVNFNNKECQFGYRDSFFKNQGKNQYVITSVCFQLQKPPHRVNTSYGAIQSVLEEKGISNPNIREVSEAVISIRESKLPDPKILGNGGSFFKNPIIHQVELEALQQKYPELPHYTVNQEDYVKVPAGWLIEKAGWKGKRVGNCGVYEKQALILVNNGGATGKEIYDLSESIISDIEDKFSILLEREVNIY